MPPEASERTVAIGSTTVAYTLTRSRRRTIGLRIDHRGLRVGAPNRASVSDIEAMLHKHGDWVLQKLETWRTKPSPEPLRIADGERWPWLGGELRLRLAIGRPHAAWSAQGDQLTLFAPSGRPLRPLMERALKEQARDILLARLGHYARLMGVQTPRLALSSAHTRWGSCNSRGEIRLNWRLAFLPLAAIDYVVAHELAHLKEMNHGPRFWSVVQSLYPDWREQRARLRRLSPSLPVF